jgi:hypothetical protein
MRQRPSTAACDALSADLSQPLCLSDNSGLRPTWSRVQAEAGGPNGFEEGTIPFDIWSDLALTALCGTALITWIGRDLAARARQWRA